MKNIYAFILLVVIPGILDLNLVNAQCSDAGVCQLSHFDEDNSRDFNVSLSYGFGTSGKDEDVTFHSAVMSAGYQFLENSSVQIQVPYNIQSGPLGNVSGIGDIILIWNQKLFSWDESEISSSLGVKLASGDENKEPALPQLYQSGLGSNDILFAVNYNISQFTFGAGYQLAGARNDNALTRLKRGDDLLFRASYSIEFDEFKVTPQILFIKRLSKSSVIDLNSSQEMFVEVEKSDQSQLNLLAELQYRVSENISITAEAAVPFIKRDVNVDGLTRVFGFSAGLSLEF